MSFCEFPVVYQGVHRGRHVMRLHESRVELLELRTPVRDAACYKTTSYKSSPLFPVHLSGNSSSFCLSANFCHTTPALFSRQNKVLLICEGFHFLVNDFMHSSLTGQVLPSQPLSHNFHHSPHGQKKASSPDKAWAPLHH